MSMYQKRRSACLDLRGNEQNEAMLITNPKNIYYLTGFYSDPHERFLGLIWNNQEWTLCVPRLDQSAAQQAVDKSIRIISYTDQEPIQEKIPSFFASKDLTKIAVEKSFISYERVQWLIEAFKQIHIEDMTPTLDQLRMSKTKDEFAILKRAGEKTDQILKAALSLFSTSMTELDLVAEIEYQAKKMGADGMSFGTTVLGQEKSALPHGHSASKKLEKGTLLIDFGITLDGYCSDMTRTFHIGPWEPKMKKIYETVLRAEQTAIKSAAEGVSFGELDSIARQIIADEGYGEYFIHRLGHGLGLEIHESPSIHGLNNERISEGMVFTIEPGIYVPGLGGVRIEDAVFIEASKAISLTQFPTSVDEMVIG
ncbi:M24 family metallopeptidase [Caldalkalibacillus mannanilyticus]|uniref:M24 family metallopeptidase n=1 Tax=Caldalkalibacillus mannanilyticus TaxID=1418 RepID=UPI0006843456|nr:Xaa-Pro peptidase family protein [Caldalkalibacillus mannanilyticus]